EFLERDEKWYLGGGGATVWAPGFPLFLEMPGYWDAGYFVNYKLGPFFTATFLDEGLREIGLRFEKRNWNPARLRQEYVARDLSVIEERCVLKTNNLASKLTVRNLSGTKRKIHLVAWTGQPSERLGTGEERAVEINASGFTFRKRCYATTMAAEEIEVLDDEPVEIIHALAGDIEADSFVALISENPTVAESNFPLWRLTPFAEDMTRGRLSNRNMTRKIAAANLLTLRHVYLGLHFQMTIPPQSTCERTVSMALGLEPGEVDELLKQTLSRDPVSRSEADWNDFFSSVPHFTCSDGHFQKYYWYRWYGINLNRIEFGRQNLKHPCVFEGPNIGWFRNLISYSAQCHVFETRWMRSPVLAQGALLNFFENQADTGYFPAKIGARDCTDYDVKSDREAIYHANWGRAVLAVDEVHPDIPFLERAYPALSRCVEFFDRARDEERTDLYDVINQGETGQEYMPRYVEADPFGDMWLAFNPPIKGVDASVYLYETKDALARIALRLGMKEEAARWFERAGATANAIREKMWDGSTEMFCDLSADRMQRLRSKSAVCFYPFMTDIAEAENLGAIRKHLLNPDEFWTEYPVPSTSIDNELSSLTPEWKGMRRNCPWNGRTWPMTNSHVCEALARASLGLDPGLRPKAAELIGKFIQMMFFEGDVERPNCFEHYNPRTGLPCEYRGCDDYQHSWVVDIIIRYVAGFRPSQDNSFVVDPFPFGLDYFRLADIPFKGRLVTITWSSPEGLRIEVDGRLHAEEAALKEVVVHL
ncbi:MAG: hypothetical protein JSV16_03320, partial [Candidatus Hydrogenedentota bacterium]